MLPPRGENNFLLVEIDSFYVEYLLNSEIICTFAAQS